MPPGVARLGNEPGLEVFGARKTASLETSDARSSWLSVEGAGQELEFRGRADGLAGVRGKTGNRPRPKRPDFVGDEERSLCPWESVPRGNCTSRTPICLPPECGAARGRDVTHDDPKRPLGIRHQGVARLVSEKHC